MTYVAQSVECKVCGSRRTSKAFDSADAPGFSVWACADCRSGRTWPAPPESEIGAYYPETYYGKENVRFNPLFEALTRWFRRRRAAVIASLSVRGTAIDVGCGRGMMLGELRRRGFTVHGIELSDTAAFHARERLGIPVTTGSFLDTPLPSRSVQVLIFWHSLEHLHDIDRVMAKAADVVAAGGLLVVAVPNFTSLQACLFGEDWFHLDIPRHYHHLSGKALEDLVSKHGFCIRSVAHFSLEQNPYGWIQSALNAVGFDFNFLYSALKDRSARTFLRRQRPLQAILTLLALPFVAAFAAVMTMVEVVLRRGGTIELYATREIESGPEETQQCS